MLKRLSKLISRYLRNADICTDCTRSIFVVKGQNRYHSDTVRKTDDK